MYHIVFSLLSTFIGLNLLAASGIEEQNGVNFDQLGVHSILANEVTPSPFTILPFIEPEDSTESNETNVANEEIASETEKTASQSEKVDAYNTKSRNTVTVSENAVSHSKTLIPCTDEHAACEPTVTPTSAPTLSITPTPTGIVTIHPIDPVPLPEPIKDPCSPNPILDGKYPKEPSPEYLEVCLY